MPVDMKEKIAEAARKLVMEKNVKKLTVKDIVEECKITRQAFYYHFEDIPALFRWILEKDTERLFNEVRAQADPEQGLRYFFKMAVNVAPYVLSLIHIFTSQAEEEIEDNKTAQYDYWDTEIEADVEAPADMMNVQTGAAEVLTVLGIGIAAVVIATGVSSIVIVRIKPGEILSSMS